MATKQSVTVTFQDPSGNPLSLGTVTFRLQVDISTHTSGGPQVAAGRIVSASLDSSGSCTVLLWPNNLLAPASIYFVTAYTAEGQPVWQGEMTVTE
jgi:hypothetical protein